MTRGHTRSVVAALMVKRANEHRSCAVLYASRRLAASICVESIASTAGFSSRYDCNSASSRGNSSGFVSRSHLYESGSSDHGATPPRRSLPRSPFYAHPGVVGGQALSIILAMVFRPLGPDRVDDDLVLARFLLPRNQPQHCSNYVEPNLPRMSGSWTMRILDDVRASNKWSSPHWFVVNFYSVDKAL